MVTIFVTHDNGMLGKKGNAVSFRKERGGSAELVPVGVVDDVILLGKGSISTPALHLLMEEDIPVHFIDGGGKYKGSLTSGRGKGYALKRLQFEAADSYEFTVRFVQSVVTSKIRNQQATLTRILYRNRPRDGELIVAIGRLEHLAERASSSCGLEELRGIEGIAAAEYFGVFGKGLLPPWKFTHRNRRPPRDPVNALLSFGYTLLLSRVVTAVTVAGLEPCVGFLHPEYRGRPSLALDLMEEFRSPIVDRMTLATFNQRLLDSSDFKRTEDDGLHLDRDGRQRVLLEFSRRVREETVNRANGTRSSFGNHIESQARLFVAALRGRAPYRPFEI